MAGTAAEGTGPRAATDGDLDARIFVACSWIAGTFLAFLFIALYASPIPFADDLGLAPELSGELPLSWQRLTGLHNEHLVLATKLVVVPLTRLAGDIRAAMYLQAAMLSALTLAALLVVRRLRGGTSYSDAFFPLLWLFWNNPFNLLMGFQVALTVPAVVSAGFLLAAAASPAPPRLGWTLALGLGLAVAPLCSAAGVPIVPPLAVWLFACAWLGRRSGARAASSAALAGALTGVCAVLFFLSLYEGVSDRLERPGAMQAVAATNRYLGLALGAAGARFPPWSGILVAASTVLCLIAAAVVFLRRPAERLRAGGLLAGLLGLLALAASIGLGRGADSLGGIALRYVSLPAPLLAAAYLAAVLWGPAPLRRLAQFSLFALLALLFGDNVAQSRFEGTWRRQESERILGELRTGRSLSAVARAHPELLLSPEARARALLLLKEAGLQPFTERYLSPATIAAQDGPTPLGLEPLEIVAPAGYVRREVHQLQALAVLGEAEVHFAAPTHRASFTGAFGILPASYLWAKCGGLRFSVELRREGVPPRVLLERLLQPQSAQQDRGPQHFELDVPAGTQGKLVLRTSSPTARHESPGWGFWGALALE